MIEDLLREANKKDLTGEFKKADALYRMAYDISQQLDREPDGYGAFGNYYDLTDSKKKLTNTLGTLPDNPGVKDFHVVGIDEIQEYLMYYFFAPYIKAHTNFNVSTIQAPFSVASLISNKKLIIQNMPGVHVSGTDRLSQMIKKETRNAIETKLENIGIFANDLHTSNFKVNEQKLQYVRNVYNRYNETGGIPQYKKEHTQLKTLLDDWRFYDLSDGASLFDLASMQVHARAGSVPPKQLEDFKKQTNEIFSLMKNLKGSNKLMLQIESAIRNLIL